MYRIERVLPSIAWHPPMFFFLCRFWAKDWIYQISGSHRFLDLLYIGIVLKSIPISIPDIQHYTLLLQSDSADFLGGWAVFTWEGIILRAGKHVLVGSRYGRRPIPISNHNSDPNPKPQLAKTGHKRGQAPLSHREKNNIGSVVHDAAQAHPITKAEKTRSCPGLFAGQVKNLAG